MNSSTSNSDKNDTYKELSKIKKASSILKIIIIILTLLFLALVVTVSVLFAILPNKANSAKWTNNSAKNTTRPYLENTTTNFNPNKICKNYTVGKYCDECGLAFKEPNLKIFGGQEANPNSWPSIGFIVYKYKKRLFNGDLDLFLAKEFSGFCTGTLIDRTTFLSAAQCVFPKVSYIHNNKTYHDRINIVPNKYYPIYESIFSVYLGLHNASLIDDQNLDKDISPAKRYKVANVTSHEKFEDWAITSLNDISIFKLSEEVVLNEYVQPACLPQKNANNFPTANTKVYAAGWAQLSYRGENSDSLQNDEINVNNGSACSLYSNTNFDSQICAGELDGGKGTCISDVGGPLYLKETINGTVRHVLVGIASYSYSCGNANYPE